MINEKSTQKRWKFAKSVAFKLLFVV